MDKSKKIWDIVWLVILGVFTLLLLLVFILPATQSLNPFRLLTKGINAYNFAEEAEYYETNILRGLTGTADTQVYPIDYREEDCYLYLDEKEKKPYFKTYNDYEIAIESSNEPRFSRRDIEIYGTFGILAKLNGIQTSEAGEQLLSKASGSAPQSNYMPYYETKYDGKTYLSVIDFKYSEICIEKETPTEYTTLASVSGESWKKIQQTNNGQVVLKNLDGTLFFDCGYYRLVIRLKQVLLIESDEGITVVPQTPKTVVFNFNVNGHECANGVLIANEAQKNMDIQLNVINNENVVCYAAGDSVPVGAKLKLGVSLSDFIFQRRLSSMPLFSNFKISVDIYKYDVKSGEYIFVETLDCMNKMNMTYNTTVECSKENLKSGKYKLVMNYTNKKDTIVQEYEYYFVFENEVQQ